MEQIPSTEPVYKSPAPEPFYQTWMKALTRPNEQNYIEIANSPSVNPNKAYLWLFISGTITYFVVFGVQLISLTMQDSITMDAMTVGLALICGAPIGGAFSVLVFALSVALIQWVAKMFKGQGSYTQLAYTFAAFLAPISLISAGITIFAAIPFIGILFSLVSIGVSIYALVLQVLAVKAVNRFGVGEAIGSILLPGLVIGGFICCLVFAASIMLGPVIGDMFNGIN